jgi:putative SOS response-associated peptidase YedK
MAFAGVWRDSEVPSFAIVTVAPDDLSGPDDLPAVVPLVLSPAEQERWLTQEWSKAEALVRPLHPDRIRPLGTP